MVAPLMCCGCSIFTRHLIIPWKYLICWWALGLRRLRILLLCSGLSLWMFEISQYMYFYQCLSTGNCHYYLLPVLFAGIKESVGSACWKTPADSDSLLYLCAFELFSRSFPFSFAQDAIVPYKEILQMYWEKATRFVNAQCDGLEPWQLVGLTFSSTLVGVWLHGFLFQPQSKCLKLGVFLCLGEGREDRVKWWKERGWNKTEHLLKQTFCCWLVWTKPSPKGRSRSLWPLRHPHSFPGCGRPAWNAPASPSLPLISLLLLAKPFTYCNTPLAQNPGKFIWELCSCALSHWCRVSG